MALDAIFRHGTPKMVDHTPTAAITGGTVVVVGDRPLIAHRDIAASEQGALAAGGGVYECATAAAIAVGKKVYWDDTNDVVTETSTGNTVFGYLCDGTLSTGTAGTLVHVQHEPEAT